MYLAICDDDILLCANLRRKLAAFDTGGNKLLVDEYHSGEELLKGACRAIMMRYFWIYIWKACRDLIRQRH